MSTAPQELADGLWRWTTRHPEYHPPGFEEVACFAARSGDAALLVDPLLPEQPDAVLAVLDDLAQAAATTAIVITITYHVRSAAELAARYGATVTGHPRVGRRLPGGTPFVPAGPGEALPGGAAMHAIGRPRRVEQPLHLPEHRALVFGDALLEVGGRLRMWSDERVDDAKAAFYLERFAPSVEPLLALDIERVLPTHGEAVLRDGREALAAALRTRPWSRFDH